MVVIPAGIPRKLGMTLDDLFNINFNIVKTLVEAIADNCPDAFIHIISNPVNSTVPIAAEVLKQKGVYDPKKLFGSATLSMAYAAARFFKSSLRALDGDGDVYKCAFFQSELTELPYFASRIKLGKKGVEAIIPSDLQGLTKYEQKALEALKPELKGSIVNLKEPLYEAHSPVQKPQRSLNSIYKNSKLAKSESKNSLKANPRTRQEQIYKFAKSASEKHENMSP